MRIAFLLIYLFSFVLSATGQGENNIWVFGDSCGLDFNTIPPTPFVVPGLSSVEGVASVSDEYGKLLFYTDGYEIWNQNFSIMPSSVPIGTNGGEISQVNITRQPGSKTAFFIFFPEDYSFKFTNPKGFRYSTVNTSLAGNLGDVVINNQFLFKTSTQKVISVPFQNGAERWIVTHDYDTNLFRSYKLHCGGIDTNFITSCVGSIHGGSGQGGGEVQGYMKVSPNNKLIALAVPSLHLIEIFQFDQQTGILSNSLSLPQGANRFPYCVEFSPNSKMLFFVDNIVTKGRIFQYDLSNYNMTAVSATFDSITVPGQILNSPVNLQLGPDELIYVVRRIAPFISAIASPDSQIQKVIFIDTIAIWSNGSAGTYDLPHLHFIPDLQMGLQMGCNNDSICFMAISNCLPDSFIWNFGDPASGTFDTSSNDTTWHIYQNPGQYVVTLISYRSCESDTSVDTITIGPPILAIPDTVMCDAIGVTLDAGNPGMEYLWSTGDTTQSIFIGNPGNYSVSVTDSNGCIAFDTALVSLDIPASANYGFDTSGCPSVQFSDSSSGNPLAWKWYFGDGDSSNVQSPAHTYAGNGKYPVMLIVSDDCGNDTLTDTLYVDCIENRDGSHTGEFSMHVFPNPNSGEFTVEIGSGNQEIGNLSVHNVLGQLITEYPVQIPGIQKINLGSHASGVYAITLLTERGRMRVKVVKGQ